MRRSGTETAMIWPPAHGHPDRQLPVAVRLHRAGDGPGGARGRARRYCRRGGGPAGSGGRRRGQGAGFAVRQAAEHGGGSRLRAVQAEHAAESGHGAGQEIPACPLHPVRPPAGHSAYASWWTASAGTPSRAGHLDDVGHETLGPAHVDVPLVQVGNQAKAGTARPGRPDPCCPPARAPGRAGTGPAPRPPCGAPVLGPGAAQQHDRRGVAWQVFEQRPQCGDPDARGHQQGLGALLREPGEGPVRALDRDLGAWPQLRHGGRVIARRP